MRFVLLAMLAAACGSRAQPPPKPAPPPMVVLSSPGPLATGHDTIDCLECHATDRADRIDNNKCLDCHEHANLRARIVAGRGLHASAKVRGKPCASCHLDHKGASYELVNWNVWSGGKQGLDHALTGWPLAGKHASVDCAQCHPGDQFAGADRLCGSCHATPHATTRRQFEACDRCHETGAWRPTKRVMQFDHNDRRDTSMPLVGPHGNASCGRCHTGWKFGMPVALPATPASCENCHQSPHGASVFSTQKCEACHSPVMKAFKPTIFDHDEHSRFDLGASHRNIACAACHTTTLGAKLPSKECETCHAARAVHKDRFKALGTPVPACGRCHTPSVAFDPAARPATPPRWPVRGFDHAKLGNWRLTAKHATLQCRACHRGSGPTAFEKLPPGTNCTGCHQHKNVHDLTYGNTQCRNCHFAPG